MKTRLKLTTRGQYAVVAMVEIGRDGKKAPVPLSDIAETTNISLSYLEQLIAGLRRHGLVTSYRGPGGRLHTGQARTKHCGIRHPESSRRFYSGQTAQR